MMSDGNGKIIVNPAALAMLRALIAGMEAATAARCVEHLDCWDDADEMWHKPLAAAKSLTKATP